MVSLVPLKCLLGNQEKREREREREGRERKERERRKEEIEIRERETERAGHECVSVVMPGAQHAAHRTTRTTRSVVLAFFIIFNNSNKYTRSPMHLMFKSFRSSLLMMESVLPLIRLFSNTYASCSIPSGLQCALCIVHCALPKQTDRQGGGGVSGVHLRLLACVRACRPHAHGVQVCASSNGSHTELTVCLKYSVDKKGDSWEESGVGGRSERGGNGIYLVQAYCKNFIRMS